MTVNGKPRWTCRTHVSRVEEDGVIVIAPKQEESENVGVIANLPVEVAGGQRGVSQSPALDHWYVLSLARDGS